MTASGSDRQLTVKAEHLFAELGYDGCRELREALRMRMAAHRRMVSEERRAVGLVRPRSARKPTTAGKASQALGKGFASETGIQRSKAVQRWAPHLLPEVLAGNLTTWAAYSEAIRLRDQAAVRAVEAMG
jgi:hypothetical protein